MFISVVNKLASFRMSEFIIKYVGQYSEQDDPKRAAGIFKIAALTEVSASLIAFLLVCLLAPLAAQYLTKDEAPAGWFIFYGLIILANLIAESSTGLLQIFNRYRRIATLNVWGSGITLAGIGFIFILYQWLLPAILANQGASEQAIAALQESFATQLMPYVLMAYLLGKVVGALGLTLTALREAGRAWGRGWWKTPVNLLKSPIPRTGSFCHQHEHFRFAQPDQQRRRIVMDFPFSPSQRSRILQNGIVFN